MTRRIFVSKRVFHLVPTLGNPCAFRSGECGPQKLQIHIQPSLLSPVISGQARRAGGKENLRTTPRFYPAHRHRCLGQMELQEVQAWSSHPRRSPLRTQRRQPAALL